jgi:hypothetical protein
MTTPTEGVIMIHCNRCGNNPCWCGDNMTTPETPTPRTDEQVMTKQHFTTDDNLNSMFWVHADFARQLERELAEYQRTEPLKIAERNKLREELAAAKAKLSERKTVHEWLNALDIPTVEEGKPICLLRRLRITCDQLSAAKEKIERMTQILNACTVVIDCADKTDAEIKIQIDEVLK